MSGAGGALRAGCCRNHGFEARTAACRGAELCSGSPPCARPAQRKMAAGPQRRRAARHSAARSQRPPHGLLPSAPARAGLLQGKHSFSCSCKAVPVLIELSSLQITTGTRYRAPASFASLMKRLQQQLSTRKKKKKKRIQQPDHAWYTSDPQLDQGAVPHVLTCGAGSSDRWQSAPRTCTAPRRAYTDRQQRSPEGEGGN